MVKTECPPGIGILRMPGKRIPTVALLPRKDKVFDSGSVYRPPLSLRTQCAHWVWQSVLLYQLFVILSERSESKDPLLKMGILRRKLLRMTT